MVANLPTSSFVYHPPRIVCTAGDNVPSGEPDEKSAYLKVMRDFDSGRRKRNRDPDKGTYHL
jgi:hypothetical protein